ncbi:MAG: ATP-binding protein [Gemmatimonas sp.]
MLGTEETTRAASRWWWLNLTVGLTALLLITIVGWEIWLVRSGHIVDSGTRGLLWLHAASTFPILVVFARLYSARVRESTRIAAAEGRMQAQLDVAPITVVRLDRHGRITAVNEAWRTFARENGADAATVRGIGLDYLADRRHGDPALSDSAPDPLQLVISGQSPSCSFVYPCHSASEARWFRLVAHRLAAEDAVVIVHTDITDHHVVQGHVSMLEVVADALAARAPLLESCDRLVRTTCLCLDWDFAAVWVCDDGVNLRCASTWMRSRAGLKEFDRATNELRFPIGEGLPGQVWSDGAPKWLASLSHEPRVHRSAVALDAGLQTGFAVPLGAAGKVFAVVEFFGRIQRAPDYALLELLATSGAQLGAQMLLVRAEERTMQAEAERQQARDASEEGDHRFQQVLDALPDLVIVKEPGSRIIWANKALRDLYGMSNDALRGLIDATHNEPDITLSYVRDDALVFSTGKQVDIPDEPVTRFDGEVRRFHTTKSPIFDSAGNVVMLVSICHDITDSMRMENELRLTARLASVGTLAAGVAHEINTPVQFINDSLHFLRDASADVSRLMRRLQSVRRMAIENAPLEALRAADAEVAVVEEAADMPYLNEHVPKAFERCIDGLDRVSTIVRSLKAFAHPAQHEMAAIDLNRAIESTLIVAQSEYKYVATVTLDLGELPTVTCNVDDINQVVLNLVVNASHAIAGLVKDNDAKGVITVRTRLHTDHVVIEIGDTGGGIPLDVGPRIFEPFFTTKGVGQGTGQGLALAWSIVTNKHGGQLTFESTPGVGTTFFVRLPVHGRAVPIPTLEKAA